MSRKCGLCGQVSVILNREGKCPTCDLGPGPEVSKLDEILGDAKKTYQPHEKYREMRNLAMRLEHAFPLAGIVETCPELEILIIDAIRSAIDNHGPLSHGSVCSVGRRVIGVIKDYSRDIRSELRYPESGWRPDYRVRQRRVVSAAMRKDGRLIVGPRHFDKVMRAQMRATEGIKWWRSCEQGFIDQFGDFMTREEAWEVAEAADQLLRDCGTSGRLYSEHLY